VSRPDFDFGHRVLSVAEEALIEVLADERRDPRRKICS